MATSNLRTEVAFALNLADSLAIAVKGVNADGFGAVSLYAWDMGADAIDAIADAEGWPSETRSGEGWRDRRQSFDVDGRRVTISVVARTPERIAEVAG